MRFRSALLALLFLPVLGHADPGQSTCARIFHDLTRLCNLHHLNLVAESDPVLYRPAHPVDPAYYGSPELAQLIRQMTESMRAKNGLGIAAPQVGVGLRVFIARVDGNGAARAFVNPRLRIMDPTLVCNTEGCLSLPGRWGNVYRPRQVAVDFFDEHGHERTIRRGGTDAWVLQHEHDHLEGILYPDRMREHGTR